MKKISELKKSFSLFLFFIGFVFLPTCSFALGSKDAKEEGREKVEEMLTFVEKQRETLRTNYNDETYRTIFSAAVDKTQELIDFNEVSMLALGAYYKKMTPAQKENFTTLFHKLISSRSIGEREKPDAEVLNKQIPFKITGEFKKRDQLFNKDAIVVKSEVWDDKITYEVEIYFYRNPKNKNNLKVYDVYIDEASLLLDYRNQFTRIVKDKGIDYLISLLQKKIKDLDTPLTPK